MAAAEALGIQITAHYYTLLVKALCKAGKPGTTRILLQNLVDSGQIPPEPVWRTAIHCQGVAGRADHAQAMFDKMREVGVEPQLETWGSLVNAYAECYMPEKAMAAMNAMRAAGLRGNPQAYVALLKSCTHAASVPAALGAVRQMQEDGLTPNEHVWGALISACAAGGDAKAAREAFAAMRAANCPAGVVQYTALLTAHRNARDLAGGLQVLREMDAEGIAPTRETFTEIITLLGQHGEKTEQSVAGPIVQPPGPTFCLVFPFSSGMPNSMGLLYMF